MVNDTGYRILPIRQNNVDEVLVQSGLSLGTIIPGLYRRFVDTLRVIISTKLRETSRNRMVRYPYFYLRREVLARHRCHHHEAN